MGFWIGIYDLRHLDPLFNGFEIEWERTVWTQGGKDLPDCFG
jgi:hypothetical protein